MIIFDILLGVRYIKQISETRVTDSIFNIIKLAYLFIIFKCYIII